MSLAEQLAALKSMLPAQLRAAWREEWRKSAPDIGPDLMRLGIAWRIQSRVHGGMPTATRKAIEQALARLERTGGVANPHAIVLKTGTRLIREWHGRTHHVLVLEQGFEYDGRRYESLSQVARSITGAYWSGPAFFGLRKRKAVNRDG